MKLPIDVVPGTDPPVFRWAQVVDTPVGKHVVEHEGVLPPTVEGAVESLVAVTKQLLMENAGMRGVIKGHTDRAEAASKMVSIVVQPTSVKRTKQ